MGIKNKTMSKKIKFGIACLMCMKGKSKKIERNKLLKLNIVKEFGFYKVTIEKEWGEEIFYVCKDCYEKYFSRPRPEYFENIEI